MKRRRAEFGVRKKRKKKRKRKKSAQERRCLSNRGTESERRNKEQVRRSDSQPSLCRRRSRSLWLAISRLTGPNRNKPKKNERRM